MRTQRIIFTALPQGLAETPHGRVLRLLALVSPRLYTNEGLPVPRLELFPDFVDWPATKISWAVSFGGHQPVKAIITGTPPGSAAWKAVFSAHSYVEPYEYQSFSGRVTRSFPHAAVRQFIYDLYGGIARAASTSFPSRSALVAAPASPPGRLNPIAFGRNGRLPGKLGPDSEEQANSTIEDFLTANLVARTADLEQVAAQSGVTGSTGIAMLLAKGFLQPRTPGPSSGFYADLAPLEPPGAPGKQSGPGPKPPKAIDFHQVVSALGDHGALMRALGLVVELTVPVPTGPLAATVELVPTWEPKLGDNAPDTRSIDITPSTLLDPSGWPAPRLGNTHVASGYFRFELENHFTPIEVDTDGAGIKLLDLARTLWSFEVNGAATPATPRSSSVPSLRQSGIAIAQLDRAWSLANRSSGLLANADSMNEMAEADPPTAPKVGVEDLALGVRVDVYDETRKRWLQLCARSAADAYGEPGAAAGYVLGSQGSEVTVAVPAGDEGFVSAVATSDSTSGGSSDLYLNETLFRWDGWSLVGSRPGKTLGESPHLPVVDQQGNTPSPGSQFPVKIDYVATPGTLPLLRFGRTYRLRGRVADLAGGGPPFDPEASSSSFGHATAKVTYGRFEPVPPPVLLMRAAVSEGERLERLVIRSNYDIPDDSPGATVRIAPCVRHVAAPAMAELLAEQHGMFDGTQGLDAAAYGLIAKRSGATIGAVAANRRTPDPNLPSQQGQGRNSGVYYDTDHLQVPYLPDVLARAAMFSGLPGSGSGARNRVPFYDKKGGWPSTAAFRLELVGEGRLEPVLSETSDGYVLKVSLPKAAVVEVQRSCAFDQSDLGQLGMWEWLRQQGVIDPKLRAAVLDGQVWMLTPSRRVVLVHAVRQPLEPPAFSDRFEVQARQPNSTTATLHDPALSFDRASTSRIEVAARWQEWVDNGKNPDPDQPLATAARVGEVLLESSGPDSSTLELSQHFNDTRGRQVAYSLSAVTRFAEYFVERVRLELGADAITIHPAGVMAGSVVVTGSYQGKSHTFLAGRDYTSDDAAGTIERTPHSKISPHQELLVAFVALPVNRSSLEGRSGDYLGVVRKVPATTRPAAPDVLYALPAWSFSGPQRKGETLESARVGGALRVYLRRPWWSSGGGEQLGVVLADPDGSSIAPYFTQWGNDPLWHGYTLSTTGAPTSDDFPLALNRINHGMELAEATGSYGVAAHQVGFDKERNLWFCDIQLSTALTYFPFVRLALARFQPNAIKSARLSRVVVADCYQTVPNRSTVVDTSTPGVLAVTVSGPWYQAGSPVGMPLGPGNRGGSVYAQIEKQTPGLHDELSWLPFGDQVALAPTTDLSNSGLTTWAGSLLRPKASGNFRLAVWEQQEWPTEVSGNGSPAARIVFLDTIPI